jgi:hypothetical protein
MGSSGRRSKERKESSNGAPTGSRSALGRALAEVNDRIFELAGANDAAADVWEFLCECGEHGCTTPVRMPLADFARLRGDGEPVHARGHPRPRARRSGAAAGSPDAAAALPGPR